MKCSLLVLLIFSAGFFANSWKAQNVVLVPFSGSNSVACGSNFLLQDHAGSGIYADNANGFTVIDAGFQGVINITGPYVTESCCDPITIYNGIGTTGSVIGTYVGTGNLNFTSLPGQTITVRFVTDGSVVYAGFDFTVTSSGPCLATPCSGTPPSNTVLPATYSTCPILLNPNLSLTTNYPFAGITYQWQSSTVSPVGPYAPIANATLQGVPVPTLNTTTWYQAVVTCTNSGGSFTTAPSQFFVSGTTTNSVPYSEGFESIQLPNRLPNCSWSASNLNTATQTYTAANTLGRTPRTGSRFASFYNTPAGTNYFYTNGINLVAGVTYSTDLWYQTDYYGYNNWTDLSILYGTTQSTTGLVNVASTNGPAVSNIYKQLSNTFTVATSGLYYFAIRATASTAGGAQYLNWDDFSITIPCTPSSGNNPSVAVSASSSTICAGQTLAVTATGAASYTWNGSFSGANYTVNPSGNSIYSVVGANALTGCTATANSSVTVSALPLVSLVAATTVVCIGQSVNIAAVGANSYTWNTGSNAQQVSVSPSTVSNYSVTGANALGCRASASIAITVNALPNIVATASPSQICIGQTSTLQASGAVSYQWTYSNLYSQSNTALVTGNSNYIGLNNYIVTGTDANGCSRTSTVALNVNPSPNIVLSGPSLVCPSASFSLIAFGASSYTWLPGNLIGNTAVTSLTSNTTFTVLGTNAFGCSNSLIYPVTVGNNNQPAILAVASSSSACTNQPVNLSAMGATSYTWYPGSIIGQFITVSPTVTTNYTVTGLSTGNCAVAGNTYVSVFINPAPILSLTASSSTLCAGSSATLTASGATTYSWFPLYSLGTTFVASPISSMIYTVNGTNASGCAGSQTLNLTVVNLPSVSISSFGNSICSGSSATLAAIGANTYLWSNGATSTSIVVTPTANTSYSVVGSIGSCNASNLKTISLLPLPVLSIAAETASLCAGQSVNLLALGANTYTWNTGSTTQQIAVSPTLTTTYSLSGKDANGCIATTNQLITINALPVLSITAVNNPICVGETATLNALGAANYQWTSSNLLLKAPLITVSPQSTGIFTVTGTDNNGCSSKAVATVSVNLCTGIEEAAAENQIKLYPNPSSGLIYLEMLNEQEATIVIYNAIGQIIASQKAALLNQIDLSPFSNGLYNVVVSQNNKQIYKAKVIKE